MHNHHYLGTTGGVTFPFTGSGLVMKLVPLGTLTCSSRTSTSMNSLERSVSVRCTTLNVKQQTWHCQDPSRNHPGLQTLQSCLFSSALPTVIQGRPSLFDLVLSVLFDGSRSGCWVMRSQGSASCSAIFMPHTCQSMKFLSYAVICTPGKTWSSSSACLLLTRDFIQCMLWTAMMVNSSSLKTTR